MLSLLRVKVTTCGFVSLKMQMFFWTVDKVIHVARIDWVGVTETHHHISISIIITIIIIIIKNIMELP